MTEKKHRGRATPTDRGAFKAIVSVALAKETKEALQLRSMIEGKSISTLVREAVERSLRG